MISQTFTIIIERILTQSRKVAKWQRIYEIFLNCLCSFLNFASLRLCVFALIFFIPVAAQKVAILSPDGTETSRSFAERLESKLSEKLLVVDQAMSEAAFSSVKTDDPFNLTLEKSKTIGSAIGCDLFVLIRSEIIRRSASKRPLYYESHAAVYAVSSRTGRLVFWGLPRFEADKMKDSQNLLYDAVGPLALELANKIRSTAKAELVEPSISAMEKPPDDGSPSAKNFRPPIPYRRIKPEYTTDAFLYDIKATVDIIVDLNEQGSILRTEIVRWAGYGLDESVEKAVRSMNWRPAERNGKPLPMRFLLRYNFKKIEKE